MNERGQVQIVILLILIIPLIAAIFLMTSSMSPIVSEFFDGYLDENGATTPDSGLHRLIFIFSVGAGFLLVGVLIVITIFKGGG